VVVNYDDNYQLIREASGLFGGVCEQLVSKHILFHINFGRWSEPDAYKERVCERVH